MSVTRWRLVVAHFWLILRCSRRRQVLGKCDHKFVVTGLLAAHARIARSHPSTCVCSFVWVPFFLQCIFCVFGDPCCLWRFDLGLQLLDTFAVVSLLQLRQPFAPRMASVVPIAEPALCFGGAAAAPAASLRSSDARIGIDVLDVRAIVK